MNWELFVAILTCALLIVGLVLLYKRGYLSDKAIALLSSTVKELPADYGNSFVNALRWYCQLAVDAVDQLVRNGTIDKDNDIRKDWALDIVEKLAAIDNKKLTAEQIDAADTMIESILGQEHKQYTPVINAQHLGTLFATQGEDAEPKPEEPTEYYSDKVDPVEDGAAHTETDAQEAQED